MNHRLLLVFFIIIILMGVFKIKEHMSEACFNCLNHPVQFGFVCPSCW